MAFLQGVTLVEIIMFGTIFCVYLFDLKEGRRSKSKDKDIGLTKQKASLR